MTYVDPQNILCCVVTKYIRVPTSLVFVIPGCSLL